jgi:hypothetical protein
MIEVVVLFFIVIVIVLCILSIMYKCTDGSMDPNGFSSDTCLKLGDPKKKDDDKSITNKDDSVTESPLLSGGNLSGSLFGSSLSGEEDEVDYSPYVDYFTISKDGVKVDIYNDEDGNGEPDQFDSKVIKDVYSPGQCAKVCYEQSEDIDGFDCNAFKMDGKKCVLYWSQTKSGVTEDENVFRLKLPRTPKTHADQALIDAEQYTNGVLMYRGVDYTQAGLLYGSNVYMTSGMDAGHYNLSKEGSKLSTDINGAPPKSFYIENGYCVKVFDGPNGTGTGTEYTNSVPDVSGKTIKSFMVGTDSANGVECEYSDTAPTIGGSLVDGEYSYYTTDANLWTAQGGENQSAASITGCKRLSGDYSTDEGCFTAWNTGLGCNEPYCEPTYDETVLVETVPVETLDDVAIADKSIISHRPYEGPGPKPTSGSSSSAATTNTAIAATENTVAAVTSCKPKAYTQGCYDGDILDQCVNHQTQSVCVQGRAGYDDDIPCCEWKP